MVPQAEDFALAEMYINRKLALCGQSRHVAEYLGHYSDAGSLNLLFRREGSMTREPRPLRSAPPSPRPHAPPTLAHTRRPHATSGPRREIKSPHSGAFSLVVKTIFRVRVLRFYMKRS